MKAEHIALSQYMRDNIPIRETVKEIYHKVFKKHLTPTCTAQSKIFSRAFSFSTKIIQHVCRLPRCQKCLHIRSILVRLITGSEERQLLQVLQFKEYHLRFSSQTNLPSVYAAKSLRKQDLLWVGEICSEFESESRYFSICENAFSLLYL